MISADQYRTGYIHLSKTGQKKVEHYDDVIEPEASELLPKALEAAYSGAIVRLIGETGLDVEMFLHVSGLSLPRSQADDAKVVPFHYYS